MAHARTLSYEKVAITESDTRILAREILSPLNHPPEDNSAMDGFALKWEDVKGASKENPVHLKVLEDITAGKRSAVSLNSGEAVAIMTGAGLPPGADTVVRVEDTDRSRGATIAIYNGGKMGQDIRRKGENIQKGDRVFEPGTLIGPAEAGMFALMNKPVVSVYRKPTVAILVTGDEIRDLDEDYDATQITNSNGYALAAQVKEAGGIPLLLGIARDNKEDLKKALLNAFESDMVLTSGGVSMGYHDYVKEVLQDIGVEIKFWRVGMRPGHPLAFGVRGDTPVFGLPGNPVSTMMSFEQFARPMIRVMTGRNDPYRPVVEATLTEAVSSKAGRMHFLRALVKYENGAYSVSTVGSQGSGVLLSMSKANALIVLSEKGGKYNVGDKVVVQLTDAVSGGRKDPGIFF